MDSMTDCLTAKSGDTRLTLDIHKQGLTLHKLVISNEESGNARDLLSGPESIQAVTEEGRKFMNPLVGRYANRLPASYQMITDINRPDQSCPPTTTLQDTGQGICLHSGKDGYDLKLFEKISADSRIVEDFRAMIDPIPLAIQNPKVAGPHETTVYYYLRSSGEEGFSVDIDVLATIKLEILSPISQENDENKLNPFGRIRFDLKAKISNFEYSSNRVSATPINLTWHNGYILNDFKALKPDQPGIYQHKLWINSQDYVEVNDYQLATGQIKPIDSFGIDFGAPPSAGEKESEFKTIKQAMPSTGFDHCFLFRKPKPSDENQKIDDEKDCKVILISPKNDLKLKFYTNQDSVQCYSANFFDGLGTRKTLHRNSSLATQSGYNKHESIYLEFQQPSGICANPELQQNFANYLNFDLSKNDIYKSDKEKNLKENPHIRNRKLAQSEFCKYTTILYPEQVYHSWFVIDICL